MMFKKVLSGWSTKRARFLFQERRERRRKGDQQLAATQSHGVISQSRYEEITGNRVTAALAGTEGFLHVEKDDFVISLRTFEGGIERVHEKGCISPAYTVMQPYETVFPGFFQYLLKSQVFVSNLQTTVTGIRDGKSVKYRHFADLRLHVPNIEIQKTLAGFLDREIDHIDKLIEKKKRFIKIVEEQEVCFTRQLLSGQNFLGSERTQISIPWIPSLPEHWQIVPLRHIAQISTGNRDTQDRREDGQFPFYVRSMTIERINSYSYNEEAVLTSGDGAGVGKVFHHVTGKFELHQRMYAFTRFRRLTGRYFFHYLKAFFYLQMTQYSAKSTVDSVRMPFLKNMDIAVPPRREQESILTKIDECLERANRVTKATRDSIDLLREYRSALITAAVTGQIDVAAWSRRGQTGRSLDAIEATQA